MLEVRNLIKKYGDKTAVNDITFTVPTADYERACAILESRHDDIRYATLQGATDVVKVSAIGVGIPFNELNSYTRPANAVRIAVERGGSRCKLRYVWVTHAQQGAPQPLFFGVREDMTCPPATRGLDPDPGEPTTIPVSGRRAVEGNGRTDSARQ